MTEKILENFSIAQICESGQCFRMEEIQDGRYQVIAGDRYLSWSSREIGSALTALKSNIGISGGIILILRQIMVL